MPLQLVHAVRTDLQLEAASAFLKEHSEHGEVIVVAPTRDAADDFVRAHAGHALIGVHRNTLDYLAAAIAQRELTSRGYAPLSALAHEALAARVIQKAAGELTYFAPVAAFPGFPRALARTLHDLRLGRITPTHLMSTDGAGLDLGRLLDLYQAELTERKLADQETRFSTATDIAAHATHPFCGLRLLLLDVPLESQLAGEFVAAMLAKSPSALIVAQSAEVADWEQLLSTRAREIPCATTSGLTSAQNHLFSREIIPTLPADTTCQLFSAPGPALEAVEIARHLRDSARDGVPFDAMAILLRRPGHYQQVVEEALRRAGIPAYFTRGTRRPDPAGRAFLALLHCALEKLTASRFAEYLSLGQVPEREDGEVRTPAGWERFIVDASVVGGPDRWQRRLDGLEAELRARYDSQPDAEEDARIRLRRELDRLTELKEFALPLIGRLSHLPARALWSEWLTILHDLANATLRRPDAVLDLLVELEVMVDAPNPEPLENVIRALDENLRFLRDQQDDYRYGRVFVGGIPEARAMHFRLVAIPGLNEGDFPRLIAGDPLLADERKRALNLAVEDERQEQHLLRTALACASERVIASYSEVDLLSGRKRVLSLYAAELMKAARGSGLDIKRLEEEAGSAHQSRAGWPAPRDPLQAIDDAEFDLAQLRDAGPGAGAYLTKVNGHLYRSLRARGRRWRERWFAEDGLTELDHDTLELLETHRLGRYAYSTSALQQFAICPYRFALRAIFRLQPAEHPSMLQRMDPAIRGSIYHEAQFEYLRSSRVLSIDDCLDRTAAAYAERLAPAIPYIWQSEVESIRADLRGWVKKMSEEPGWAPVAWELSFGLTPDHRHDPQSRPDPVTVLDRYQLRGSIDMVERHVNGVLRVVDHKTGSAPSPAPQCVGKGEVLQPLLYAMAAEQTLGEKVLTGRLHYATLRSNYREIDITMNDFARGNAGKALAIIDDAVHQGFLPAAPRAKACDTCDYRVVCGPYEEERARLKSKPELKSLRDLRAMK
ncbi:MAG TPA: PD-(D/E)XK nuclease family protein [Bryobacteraceae bacterium]